MPPASAVRLLLALALPARPSLATRREALMPRWLGGTSGNVAVRMVEAQRAKECERGMVVPLSECTKACRGGTQLFSVPKGMVPGCRKVKRAQVVRPCNTQPCIEDHLKVQDPRILEAGRLMHFRAVLAPQLMEDYSRDRCRLQLLTERLALVKELRLEVQGVSNDIVQAPEFDLESAFVEPGHLFGWKGCEFMPAATSPERYEQPRDNASEVRIVRRDIIHRLGPDVRFEYDFRIEPVPPSVSLELDQLRPDAVRARLRLVAHGATTESLRVELLELPEPGAPARPQQSLQERGLPLDAVSVEFTGLSPRRSYKLWLVVATSAGPGGASLDFDTPAAGCGILQECCQGVKDPFVRKCRRIRLTGRGCKASWKRRPWVLASDPESCATGR